MVLHYYQGRNAERTGHRIDLERNTCPLRHDRHAFSNKSQEIQNQVSVRTLKFLLQKEFRQVFRNKGILPAIFVMPIVQLLILPLAANYAIRNISLAVVDHDHSSYSRKL